MNEEEYIKERLSNQIEWYSTKSTFYQKRYKIIRIIEIASAAILPFLSGMTSLHWLIKFLIGAIGVIVAISASLSNLFKDNENWIQYRATSESLKHEKYLYLTKTAPYNEGDAFQELVKRSESIISSENNTWKDIFHAKEKK